MHHRHAARAPAAYVQDFFRQPAIPAEFGYSPNIKQR